MERQPKYQLSQPRNPLQTSSPFFIEVNLEKDDRNNLPENERVQLNNMNKPPSDGINSNRFQTIELQPSNKSDSSQSNEKQDKKNSSQQITTSQKTNPKQVDTRIQVDVETLMIFVQAVAMTAVGSSIVMDVIAIAMIETIE